MWTLTRELHYDHPDDLLTKLGTRKLYDWIAADQADPFGRDRDDLNSIRIAIAALSAFGGGSPELLDRLFDVPFGRSDADGTSEDEECRQLLEILREHQAAERAQREDSPV